mgnify:CR=1 FL=1
MNVLVEIKQSVRVEQISNSKHIGSFAALPMMNEEIGFHIVKMLIGFMIDK